MKDKEKDKEVKVDENQLDDEALDNVAGGRWIKQDTIPVTKPSDTDK